MRPLLYLTARGVVNGLRRSLTSGRRLIGLIFVIGYWGLVFVRPAFTGSSTANLGVPSMEQLPPFAHIEAVVWSVFALMSLLLALGMFGTRGGFRQADVDVLFATPVSHKAVLLFRMFREYASTLLVPLFIALVTLPGAGRSVTAFARNHPVQAGMLGRSMAISWILLALCWVCLNFAIGLFLNRTDVDGDRIRKWLGWSFGVVSVAVMGYVAWSISRMDSFQEYVALTHQLPLRLLFFSGTFATAPALAPLGGPALGAVVGLVSLLGLAAAGVHFSLLQSGWMYDQAATRGSDAANVRSLQQKGDVIGAVAEQARKGKVRGASQRWYHRIEARGARALIWKEAIVQLRSTMYLSLIVGGMTMAMTLLPLIFEQRNRQATRYGEIFMMFAAMGVFVTALTGAQTGYFEMLRRVDLLKPLPFKPFVTVMYETAGKVFVVLLPLIPTGIIALCLRPSLLNHVLAAFVAMPFFALVIYAAVALITVMFPDIDDASQRGFRGMMQLLGLAIVCAPSLLLYSGLRVAEQNLHLNGLPPLVCGLITVPLNVAIAFGLTVLTGQLYSTYNPSE